MIRNQSISFNNLFRPSYFKKNFGPRPRRTRLTDDIYDRWHGGGAHVNEMLIEEDEQDPRVMSVERKQVAETIGNN